jgi:nicotinamide-nucleotide amidase
MALNIAVLTTGDELINGEMADTNTRQIARMLGAKGYAIRESRSVGDIEREIEQALLDLAAKRDVVIVTGGLGPTEDDLTARAAARAFSRPLALNDEALRQVRDFFHRNSLEMNPRNEKQALLPNKSAILSNLLGTAPGFTFCQGETELFFLPGVPKEMVAMLELEVLPRLQARDGGQLMQERILKVFGLSEPRVEEKFGPRSLPEGTLLGFGVEFPFVHVKLRAVGDEAEEILDRAELAARRLLEPYIFGRGEETLPGNVGRMLANSGLSIALAESCTGGMIAAMLTDLPGASAFLERGAVTYANSAKRDWLGVSNDILDEEGAVSEACALAMARGIREAAKTDLGLAVTGIAGPEGGTPQKPVGTVFLALCGPALEKVEGFRFHGDREKIRRMSACMALDWVRRYLNAHMAGF